MRKIINSTYISLDAVIEDPQDWPPSDVEDDTAYTIQRDLLFACDEFVKHRTQDESA
jgi:hypothetical protein